MTDRTFKLVVEPEPLNSERYPLRASDLEPSMVVASFALDPKPLVVISPGTNTPMLVGWDSEKDQPYGRSAHQGPRFRLLGRLGPFPTVEEIEGSA